MATSLVDTGVQFPDSSIQTTAFSNAAVMNATAAASYGSVGTYLLATVGNISTTVGSTIAGSSLTPLILPLLNSGGYSYVTKASPGLPTLSGTWRIMIGSYSNVYGSIVFVLRIS